MIKREVLIPFAVVFGTFALIAAFIIFVYKPCIPCALSNSPIIEQEVK